MRTLLFSFIALSMCLNTTKAAEKIVSTAGYASEIVAALGKADKLVGVDTTSVKPQTIMEKNLKSVIVASFLLKVFSL
ncbi:hypothetical protein NJNGDCLN_01360 [Mannheimia haemolytica]